MNIRFQVVEGLALASVLASGIISTGVAASAQTTTASTSANASSVAMATVDPRAARRAALEQANADARRVEFRNRGTSF